jgi:hypothetical protein
MASAVDQVDEAKVQSLQFDGRLVKPFDPVHLRKILSTVLQAAPKISTPVSPAAPMPSSDPLWEKTAGHQTSDESGWEVKEVGERTLTDLWKKEPALKPPPGMLEDPEDFYKNAPESGPPEISLSELVKPKASSPDLEQMVRRMVEEKLPEIAERIVREELNKILST